MNKSDDPRSGDDNMHRPWREPARQDRLEVEVTR
jgi:hypothetical protein